MTDVGVFTGDILPPVGPPAGPPIGADTIRRLRRVKRPAWLPDAAFKANLRNVALIERHLNGRPISGPERA